MTSRQDADKKALRLRRREAVREYAIADAGSQLDLDQVLEAAAVEELMSALARAERAAADE